MNCILYKVRPENGSALTFNVNIYICNVRISPVRNCPTRSGLLFLSELQFFLLMYIYLEDAFVYINQSTICVWYIYDCITELLCEMFNLYRGFNFDWFYFYTNLKQKMKTISILTIICIHHLVPFFSSGVYWLAYDFSTCTHAKWSPAGIHTCANQNSSTNWEWEICFHCYNSVLHSWDWFRTK